MKTYYQTLPKKDPKELIQTLIHAAPTKPGLTSILNIAYLDTTLGPMIVIASDEKLYLLEFVNRQGIEREVERLLIKTNSAIIPGTSAPIMSIEQELQAYFKGSLTQFNTPICLIGTPFQITVWNELQKIPYGETRSYTTLAKTIAKPTAFRAVAQANGANQLAIIIPCHRVINSNGGLSGYAGGISRKQWLLDLEKNQ